MKLRDDDKDWLKKEVSVQVSAALEEVVNSLRPHGWKKVTHWLREWGLAGTAMTVPVALLALCVTLAIFAASDIKENTQFRTYTEDRLKAIESFLHDLDSHFKAIRLMQLSDSPRNPQSIASTKEIIKQAIEGKVPISADAIEVAGTPFIEAADDPAAWNTALSFLTYRSVLNVSLAPSPVDLQPVPADCTVSGKSFLLTPPSETIDEMNKSQRIALFGSTASDEDAARMEEIAHPAKKGCGIKFILYEMLRPDNELLIDGLRLKNVIIRNTRVAYRGGPIQLENVYFVNCTFDFAPAPQSQGLATAILSSPETTFRRA
jgi:hypothetical protein